jgi:hypothetical protein
MRKKELEKRLDAVRPAASSKGCLPTGEPRMSLSTLLSSVLPSNQKPKPQKAPLRDRIDIVRDLVSQLGARKTRSNLARAGYPADEIDSVIGEVEAADKPGDVPAANDTVVRSLDHNSSAPETRIKGVTAGECDRPELAAAVEMVFAIFPEAKLLAVNSAKESR